MGQLQDSVKHIESWPDTHEGAPCRSPETAKSPTKIRKMGKLGMSGKAVEGWMCVDNIG